MNTIPASFATDLNPGKYIKDSITGTTATIAGEVTQSLITTGLSNFIFATNANTDATLVIASEPDIYYSGNNLLYKDYSTWSTVATTNAQWTASTNTMQVYDETGLVAGLRIKGDGIPSNTFITEISGNAVSINNNLPSPGRVISGVPQSQLTFHHRITSINSASDFEASSVNTFYGSTNFNNVAIGSVTGLELISTGTDYLKPPALVVENSVTQLLENWKFTNAETDAPTDELYYLNWSEDVTDLWRANDIIFGVSSNKTVRVITPVDHSTANSTFSRSIVQPFNQPMQTESGDILIHESVNRLGIELEDSDWTAGEVVMLTPGTRSANLASSNVYNLINTRDTRGRGASLTVGELSTGAIKKVSVSDAGVGYTSDPNIDLSLIHI